MPDYHQGGYIGGPVTARNDTGTDEPVLLSRGCRYFSPQALERYGRETLEKLFPNTDIEEMPDDA